MKGKLPVTQIMVLESEETQWRLLVNNLIDELRTSALIEKLPNYTVRINLVFDRIIPPENSRSFFQCVTKSSLGERVATGISKSTEFLFDYLDKSCWLFLGFVDGSEKIPILIIHYESINLTIYTLKLKEEKKEAFFASLN